MIPSREQIECLPGGVLILSGIEDLKLGKITVSSCLVAVSYGKLRRAGLVSGNAPFHEPEQVLYRLLCKEGGNSYGRYNSLIRELISFGRALAHLTKADKTA